MTAIDHTSLVHRYSCWQITTNYSVFSFPPATPIANSVIVTPADPYITPTNNDYTSISPLVNFKISILVPLLDNEGNLAGIETDICSRFCA